MELPPYRVPRPRAVLQQMAGQGRDFVVRAGTLILATSVVIWALSYFPRDAATLEARDRAAAEVSARRDAEAAAAPDTEARAAVEAARGEDLARVESEANAELLRRSAMGRMGRAVEPAFLPIGWDWKVGVAVIASFPAREVVVGTLGVIYGLGDEVDEESEALRDRLRAARFEDGPRRGQPVFTLASALALMVFFALCCQCVSTLAVMWRETGSWRWPALAFGYMTVLAYVAALVTARVVEALSG